MRKLISCVSVLALVASTSANAFTVGNSEYDDPTPVGASAATKLLMQAQCNDLASAHAPDVYTGTLDVNSIEGTVVSGSETPTGDQAKSNFVGIGDPISESIQVATEPYRIGGSVNMFGLAEVVAAHYADSEYDFTQNVTWTSNYAFTCNMTETVHVPDLGFHKWTGPIQASDTAKAECEFTNSVAHQYDDRGANCEFVVSIPAHDENQNRDPEYGDIDQPGESGTLGGHASSGGGQLPVDVNAEPIPPVQVVVCISPNPSSKKTQSNGWAQKNGYTGPNCNTTYYNSAPVGPQNNLNTGSNNVVTIPAA